MEIKEAIWIIEQLQNNLVPITPTERQALQMALSALEKQDGKKPNGTKATCITRLRSDWARPKRIYSGFCPGCGCGNDSDNEYCWKCGQRLDWSEVDDG